MHDRLHLLEEALVPQAQIIPRATGSSAPNISNESLAGNVLKQVYAALDSQSAVDKFGKTVKERTRDNRR